jgi:hypothetical protein
VFCDALREESGLTVVTGPVEATVLGNLALQFLGSGIFESKDQMQIAIDSTLSNTNPQDP